MKKSNIYTIKLITVAILLCFGFSQRVSAQTVVAAEYFFNVDPGVGNGTPITVPTGANITANLSVPTTGLPPGFNHLFFRFKDSNGKWSHYENRTILIRYPDAPTTQVVNAEYFFDIDPGVGNATPFSFTAGNDVTFSLSVNTTGLSDGFHSLFFRVRDAAGKWSLYNGRIAFIKTNIPNYPLVYGEYFFDVDSGVGTGVPFVFPAVNDKEETLIINTSMLLPGDHRLVFRFRDSVGVYSLNAAGFVRICDVAALANFTADTVCLGGSDSTTFVNLSTGGDSATTYRWDFDGNGSNDYTTQGFIGGGSPYTFKRKYTTGGIFNCRLVTDNGGGCSDTIIKQVVVIAYPPPPIPTGPAGLCVNSANTTFTIPQQIGATGYVWQLSPVNAGTMSYNNTSATVDWNNTYTGIVQIRVKALYDPCTSDESAPYSNNLVVTISPQTIGGTITLTQSSICEGSSTGNMSLSGHLGSILRWQKRLNNGAWLNVSNTNAVYSETPTAPGTWDYRVVVKNAACDSVYSNYATVTVNPKPDAAGTIIGPVMVCEGQFQVSYSVPAISGATSYTWTAPFGATVTGQGSNTILVNFNMGATSGSFQVFGSNSCGIGATSPLYGITVNPAPIANAGVDQVIQYNATATLSGSAFGGTSPYTFAWSPSALFQNNIGQSVQTDSLQNSIPFTLTVTDNLGCTGTDQMNVIVVGQPLVVTATADPSIICQGDSTQLNAVASGGQSGSYQYFWTSNPLGFTSSLKNPKVAPTATTQYTVAVTDGNQTATHSVTVTISPKPLAAGTITGTPTVCRGDNGVIFTVPTIANASGYVWSFPNGATITSGSNTNTISVAFGLGAFSGNISVYGTNICGTGANSPNFFVTVNQTPIADAGPQQSITLGTQTTLNGSASGGSGNYSFEWSPTTLLVNPTAQNPTTTILNNSSTFTLTVTDNVFSCKGTSSVLVLVSGFPLSATTSAVPGTVCQGGTSQINALPTGGPGNYTFAWSSVPVGLVSTSQNPTVTPTVTTEYIVTVTSGTQTTTSNVIVTVSPLPGQAGAITGDNVVCRGDNNVTYTVTPVPGANAYFWSLPTGATIASGNGTNTIVVNYSTTASSGNISVYASNFCGSGLPSANFFVTVNLLPIADAGSDIVIAAGNIVTLQGSASGGSGNYSYYWTPSLLLDTPTITNPTTIPMATSTTYSFAVTDNATSCTNTSYMQVIIQGGPLSATASATPQNLCQGSTTQLNALPQGGTGNYTYLWTSDPVGPTSSIKNPVVSPSESTTYTVEVYDGFFTSTASVVVTINPLPITAGTITGDVSVCQGENGVVYEVPFVQQATGYNWILPTGAILASGANTNSITVNYSLSANSGNITVYGTNFCGNGPSSAPLAVTVNNLPVVDAGQDITLSVNGDTVLNGSASGGSGNYIYSWTPTSSLNFPTNIPNPSTHPLATSVVFTLLVTDSITGCSATDQVPVLVTGVPLSVSVSATPQTLCQGGTSYLFALPTGGTGNNSYSWTCNPNPGNFSSNLQNPTITPTVSALYIVTISDGAGTESDAIYITVNDLPGAAGSINGPTSICKGTQNVSFNVPVIQGATSYVWILPTGATIVSGAGTNSIVVNFTAIASTGMVTVYGQNSCGTGQSSSYLLTLNPLPTANAGQDLNIVSGSYDTLCGSATGGFGTYQYTWAPAILLNNANGQCPITVALTNTTVFTLTVTDLTSGCTGTDAVTVYLSNPGILDVAAVASPQSICQGASTTLNAIPNGGLGNYTFTWTAPPSYSSNLQNPIVSPSVTTTYTVVCTSGGTTLTATSMVVVTVNPLPSAPGVISGPTVVCQNTNNVVYTVPPVAGATSYTWSLPSGASIVSGQGTNYITVSFSPSAQSGQITVSAVNLCGTGPVSAPLLVSVNSAPLVNAGNDQFLSQVGPATLSGLIVGGIGPFSYLWTPTSFFIPTTDAYLLNPQTSTLVNSVTFNLTVLDSASGCTSSDQMNVYIGVGPLTTTANATLSNICQGQSTQLNALPSGGTGNYTYLWTAFPGPYTSTLQNPVVTPSVTTQYLLKVFSGTDSASYTIVINVNPQPGAAGTITAPPLICQSATNLMFTVPPIPNAISYFWTVPPQGFTIVSGQGTNTIYVDVSNNASSGTITVYGVNSCGVGSVSGYNATVSVSPYAYTSAGQLVPQMTSVQIFGYAINGSGTYTYIWEPASSLMVNNVQNPWTDSLTQSTIFTLVVTDNVTGCQSTDNVQIIVYGGPLSVVASSNNYSICAGQSVQLNALPTGGNGQYFYTWTPASGLSNSSISNPVATPLATTEYTVQVVDGGGLTATHSVLISVSPIVGNAGNITGSTSICQGETGVLFTVPPIANATTYNWSLPFGATITSGANTNAIMVSFANNASSGNVSVYAGNSCGFGNPSPNFWVNVNPVPDPYAGADQQIQQGSNTNLSGIVTGGSGSYSYQWTPASLLLQHNDTLINPITLPINASQIFTFTVTDLATGCVGSDYMKVIVCGGPLSVSAFVNNNNICEGQTVYLDALPSGGNCVAGNYSWTSQPPPFSSTLVNPVATPSVTTTYIVTYNDGSNTASHSVVVNVSPLLGPAGPIQGPTSVCQNSGTITYSIPAIPGADNYVWSFPTGTTIVSNPDSNVVQVIFTSTAQSGFVNVYGTSFCGIGQPATPLSVVVKPLPPAAGLIVGPTYMSKNNSTQFYVPPIPGVYYYQWILPYGAVITSGQGTNSITVEFTDDSKSGFVIVFGVNSCGTGDESNMHLVTIITSTAELYGMELSLYPNPSNGTFTLDISGDDNHSFDMKVMNLFGSEVHNTVISETQTRLDFSHLPAGMYYMELSNSKMKLVERFVIVH